jgi:signal recognition particle GTPase
MNYQNLALEALQKAQYAEVFKILEQSDKMKSNLPALKKAFIKGRINADFEDQLEMAIKDAFTHSLNHSLTPTARFLTHSFTHSLTLFVGRVADLQMLKDNLQAGKRTVLVNGVGGVGKTTLAQKYVHDY